MPRVSHPQIRACGTHLARVAIQQGTMVSSSAPRFVSLAAWCRMRGFTLERRAPSGRGYTVSWRDARTRRLDTEEVATLAEVVPVVEEKINSGASRRPGVWYLYWSVVNFPPRMMPWCRWRRWVQVYIVEGGIPSRPLIGRNGQHWGDPTPYASAEECLAASALLGLESGGRLCLTAQVTHAGGGGQWLPTPEYTPEAVKELVLDCVRRSAPAESPGVKEVAKRLQLATCLDRREGERLVEEFLEDGRLVWGWEADANGEKFPVLQVAAG